MFTALVVSINPGESEVSLGRTLSAVLRSPSVVALCENLDLNASALIDRADSSQTPLFSECLWRVESELAQAGHAFGSHEHIDSIQPLRLSAEAQSVVAQAEEISHGETAVTPLHLLLALTKEPAVSAELAALGLTSKVVAARI